MRSLAHALWISRYRLDARRARRAGGQWQRRILGELPRRSRVRSLHAKPRRRSSPSATASIWRPSRRAAGPMCSIAADRPASSAFSTTRTLAIPDFRGNRQYISTGNLATNDRAALILMDYPHRRRLKIYAHVEARDLAPIRIWRRSSRCPATGRRSSAASSSISPPSTGTARSISFRDSAKLSSSPRSRRFARGSKRWKRKIRRCAPNWRQAVSRSGGPEWRRRTPEAKEQRSGSGSPTPRRTRRRWSGGCWRKRP